MRGRGGGGGSRNYGLRLNCQVMHMTVVVCSSDVRPVHKLESGEFIALFLFFFLGHFLCRSPSLDPDIRETR